MSDFGSGHHLTVCEFEPHVSCADSSESEACSDSVSPSLTAPPLLAHALSLSKINIKKVVFFLNKMGFKTNAYLFLRECKLGGVGTERGGQKMRCGLCTDSGEPHARLELTNCEIMTRVKIRRSTSRATQVPLKWTFCDKKNSIKEG